ncbi:hypothetical protein RHSIM_Rhsim03G0227800 [Rhododendron simsii]|uniref:N-acetyltransferase domain-containing protein n=1 Tax=Rhododendron simsii TaxID=118357 RepID=A0A834LSW7_RHOSS|nr:hypothetical protein RHSIM_Rhsim03G0227800 [Rhododendron simsii]
MEIHRPCFFRISSYGMEKHHKLQPFSSSWKMTLNCNAPLTRNTTESSVEHQKISVPQLKTASPTNLQLNRPLHRPRPSYQESSIQGDRIEFGEFVVREALGEEELWAVAWLRAETCWDDRPSDRYAENLKKKLAERTFDSLKRESKQLCSDFCIVTVKKEESKESNVTDDVLNSVVGTLTLSIDYMSSGQTFPGEQVKPPVCHDLVDTEQIGYGHIDDLCVAKSARRQGIASSMLLFAINLAKSDGAKRVYLQVYKSNKPALGLYRKMGFEVVDRATAQLAKKKACLLCFEW